MTMEQFAHLCGIFSYALLGAVCLPGVYRLFTKGVSPLDPLKTALFFVALANLDVLLARSYYGASLWQRENVSVWTISAFVLVATVITLVIVLKKTDAALGPDSE